MQWQQVSSPEVARRLKLAVAAALHFLSAATRQGCMVLRNHPSFRGPHLHNRTDLSPPLCDCPMSKHMYMVALLQFIQQLQALQQGVQLPPSAGRKYTCFSPVCGQ